MSTLTHNWNLELPARGDYDGQWDIPINANFSLIDSILNQIYTSNKSDTQPNTNVKDGMLWLNSSSNILFIKIPSGFKELAFKDNVLSLTGGILTGNLELYQSDILFRILNADDKVGIYTDNVTNKFGIKDFGNNKTVFELDRATDTLDIKSTNVTKNGDAIWHAGNDGDGSDLDAGKLQGKKWALAASGTAEVLNGQIANVSLRAGGQHNYYRVSVYSDITCINAYGASPSCYYLAQSPTNDALIISNASGVTKTFTYEVYSFE